MERKDKHINFVGVLNGYLAIGHRPKLKVLKEFKAEGTSHILTLLSEKEGALDIRKASLSNGLIWEWLPLKNAKPPEEEILPIIRESFSLCKKYLEEGAKIYIHCSAGIHRTGMITYSMLRYFGYSDEESQALLLEMRPLTGEGVGKDRVEWANTHFGM